MSNAHRPSFVLLTAATVLLVMAWAAVAQAAEPRDPIQREDIALIEAQLGRIEQIIDRIDARQDEQPRRRVILDIGQLRADINRIRNGLRAYLSPPRRLPRQPAPLVGRYRTQQAGATP